MLVLLFLLALALVVGGILFFRIHAFLALLGAALLVALLTPASVVEEAARGRGCPRGTPLPWHARRRASAWPRGSAARAGRLGCSSRWRRSSGSRSSKAAAPTASSVRRCGCSETRGRRRHFSAAVSCSAIPVFFDTVFYMLVPLAKASTRPVRPSVSLLRARDRRRRHHDALARAADARAALRRERFRGEPGAHVHRRLLRRSVCGGSGVRVRALGRQPVACRCAIPNRCWPSSNAWREPATTTCPRSGWHCCRCFCRCLITLQATAGSAAGQRGWEAWLACWGTRTSPWAAVT